MAKGIGLIGNFKGKVGNMVGYKLTDSNSGNNQGIRVYQPIVKNPKTAAQAEQRAKLAPINATYRALKMVIDRGNEGLPYGNKSRLAWLKWAFKASPMAWIEKGERAGYPLGVQLTKGSLTNMIYTIDDDEFAFECTGVEAQASLTTVGSISSAILAAYSQLKAGDQVTFVAASQDLGVLSTDVRSIILDPESNEVVAGFTASANKITWKPSIYVESGTIIVSREGINGEHLRSTSFLTIYSDLTNAAPYNSNSKTKAIESYRSSAAVNADWAEESIQ